MSLASSSKVQMAYVEETTYGQTPGAGSPKNLRMTGESLAYDIQTEQSAEINSSRQVTDAVQTNAAASGGINLELNYREYDPFLEALMSNVYSTAFGVDGVGTLTVTIVAAANTMTDDGIDGFAGLVAGQWIVVDTPLNAGVYRIASLTDDEITVDTDTPFASDETSVSADVSSSRLTLGTADLRSFSLEKEFSDVAQFFVFRGMSPSKLDLSFETGAILKGVLDFMGADSARGATTFMPSAPGASQAYGVMNAVSGVGTVLLDTDVIANTYIKSAKVTIDGKLRGQDAIGHLGNVGLGQGTFDIGGSLEMYLADGAIYDQAIADQLVDIQIPVFDVNNNGYAFIFNNVKLGVPKVLAGSKDADVMLSVPFTAVAPDTAADKMLIVDRYGVAAV